MTTKIIKEKSNVTTKAILVIAFVSALLFSMCMMQLVFGYETISQTKDMACYSIDIERLGLGYPFCLTL